MPEGFVYVLISPNSNYVKIGGTERPISERLRGINGTESYSDHGPWELSDFLHVTDWRLVEGEMHRHFRTHNVRDVVGTRELFDAPPHEARQKLQLTDAALRIGHEKTDDLFANRSVWLFLFRLFQLSGLFGNLDIQGSWTLSVLPKTKGGRWFTVNIGPHEVAFSTRKSVDGKFTHFLVLDRLILEYPETIIWIGKREGSVSIAEYVGADTAIRNESGWLTGAPGRVNDTVLFLNYLTEGSYTTLAGFDFPIGLPESYGEKTRLGGFCNALDAFGSGRWSAFYEVANTANEISIFRPFYPQRSSSEARQGHLIEGHGCGSIDDLRRQCELPTAARRAACPLFWTLGGNQVGKAAISGWKEIISPARRLGAKLWPFDGSLGKLASIGELVLAETYPAEAYEHVGVRFATGESKRRQNGDPERGIRCRAADHHRGHGGRSAEEERWRRHASGWRRHGRHGWYGFLNQPFRAQLRKARQQCRAFCVSERRR